MQTTVHQWTKDELKKLISVWETKTIEAITEDMKVNRKQVQYAVSELRRMGVKLSRKRTKGVLQPLIREMISSGEIEVN